MMTLQEIARAVGGRLAGPDAVCNGVVTDTRAKVAGALFVALAGERFDGHAFLAKAKEQGAAGALTTRPPAQTEPPAIVVDDTRAALGRLAAYWRNKHSARVVAVTGSNGKTTVKEMIALILAQAGPTIATAGNLNNDIGMPLTLLRLRPEHRYAVIEIGMNRPGEIAALSAIAGPDVAVVTNAGHAHLEGLGTTRAVAAEKGQIYRALRAGGVAVINADQPYAAAWRHAWSGRTITYGLEAAADVSARFTLTATGSNVRLSGPFGEEPLAVTLSVLGRHNVANAVAAAAAAAACAVPPAAIVAGLEAMHPVHGRLESLVGLHGMQLIDDTYNANPDSARAAVDVLANVSGERFLVLGDMAELGPEAAMLHKTLGAEAVRAGLEHIWTLGALAAHASAAAGHRGRHYEELEALIRDLQQAAHPHCAVLIKGSRRMGMERVVEALREEGTVDAPVVV
ncbi:MAG: UDP-N-acetylmuramoyl-tripeptide--D-alanyl-D-alanine ligase [Gammaproteobacteria bacterium]|nr:UDP-N-acetylmuramoyl-tripeptide--D-alanyl-D-alanine ligase [Gammaproteobacteria bacterium]